jgi:hypothetical protein
VLPPERAIPAGAALSGKLTFDEERIVVLRPLAAKKGRSLATVVLSRGQAREVEV